MTSHVAATQPDGAELPACPLTPRVRAPRNLLFREPQLAYPAASASDKANRRAQRPRPAAVAEPRQGGGSERP